MNNLVEEQMSGSESKSLDELLKNILGRISGAENVDPVTVAQALYQIAAIQTDMYDASLRKALEDKISDEIAESDEATTRNRILRRRKEPQPHHPTRQA
ncbi:MAG: hypothetical protein R3A46_12350 [Thermomicrobiales bacterium]